MKNCLKMDQILKMIFMTLLLTISIVDTHSRSSKLHRLHARRTKRSKYVDMSTWGEEYTLTKDEVKKLFEDYYDCITKQNEQSADGREQIKAILALEAQRVELECKICVRPSESITGTFWQMVRTSDGTMQKIDKKTKGIKIKKDLTLLIKSVDVTDAGQYFCVRGSDPVVIYQLDVLFKEPQKTVSENDTDALQPPMKLLDHNLEVFSHWAEWSECDQCGKNGRRLKFGTCIVRKSVITRPVTPVDVPILSLYPDGVPCRSTILPRQAAHFPGVKNRKSEVITGYCYEPCPTTPTPIQVTDVYGKVIDVVEAGYQPLHRKPEVPPMVIRKVLYKPLGSYEILTCPSSDTGKIRWQRGERPINVVRIKKKTKGRVYVDRLNRLHIRRLRLRDTAAFSCWVWQRHVATIKVIVYEAMNDDIKHLITYGGLFLTVFVILTYCTWKLFFGRPKRSRG